MEFDATPYDVALLTDILRNYGPTDMSLEQEEMLSQLAELLKHCADVGTTLHINCR